MTLQQLQYITALYTERNFVSAAEKCFVTQPALTTQVKKLEDELGVLIFDRTQKPLVPTEIGLKIIEQADDILLQCKKIPDLITEYKNDISGDLNVGILPTIGLYLLPLFINSFLSKHTSTRIHASESITEDIITQINNGQLDVGIIATPIPNKNVLTIPIYYEEMFAYISKEHPFIGKSRLAGADLLEKDLWLLSSGHCFRNQMIRICHSESKTHLHSFTYESNSIEALKRVIGSKQGMTIIPELALADISEEEKRQVKKFKNFTPVRQISLVVSRAFLKKRLIEELAAEIKLALPAHMQDSKGREIINPF